MQSLSMSFSLNLPSASSLTNRAARLITNTISSTFDVTTRNAIVRRIIRGHQFESVLLAEPTKCSHCNQMIWIPAGQKCKLCRFSSHSRCLNSIETRCVVSAYNVDCQLMEDSNRGDVFVHHKDEKVAEQHHKLEAKILTKPLPTMCDHCGTYVLLLQRYKECLVCSRIFHSDCLKFVPSECHLRQQTQDKRLKGLSQVVNSKENSKSSPSNKQGLLAPVDYNYDHTSHYSIDQFDIYGCLGRGSFSKVYLAKFKSSKDNNKQAYAIKVIEKTNSVIISDPASAFTEWKALKLGRSYPFLTIAHCCFQSCERLFFVMEYVEGRDLLYYVSEEGPFSEDRARFYSAELVLALTFLHSKWVIYRDVKLNNILLDKYGHCKLIDFGMAKIVSPQRASTRTFCGTPYYISPEILRAQSYKFSVDWWSLGVVMYEMLCNEQPFTGKNDDELFEAIKGSEPKYSPRLSARARSILDGLLTKDPSQRLGCQLMDDTEFAIKSHEFFKFETSNGPAYLWPELESKQIKPPYIPTHCTGRGAQLSSRLTTAHEDWKSFATINPKQLEEINQLDWEDFSQCSESFQEQLDQTELWQNCT